MIELIHGNALCEALPEMVAECAAMLTDPPFSKHVHESATSQSAVRGTRKRDLGFDYLRPVDRHCIAAWAQTVKRWSVVYSDVESVNWLRISCEAAGAEYVRTVPWVRWSMPQLSGDRPPQGFEALICCHRQQHGARGGKKPMRKHWNGSWNPTAREHLCLRGEGKNKAEKPLDQALDLVSWFTDPGETVFDPYAGRATIGLACKLLGRGYLGFEIRATEHKAASHRLASPLTDRDIERAQRWLLASYEPASAPVGPATRRADSRVADRARVYEAIGLKASAAE